MIWQKLKGIEPVSKKENTAKALHNSLHDQ